MANAGGFPVILKKFEQNVDPCLFQAAEVSRKCRILAVLGSDCTLKLWNLKNDARCSVAQVKQ